MPTTKRSSLPSSSAIAHTTTIASRPIAIAAEESFEETSLAVIRPDAEFDGRTPKVLRFPLLVLGTLMLSAAGYSVLGEALGRRELSGVSRTLRGWWEVGAVVGWRTAELALGWYGDLDGYDITALGLLSRGPTLYLLSAFYDISAPTILSSLLIDFAATFIPFRLLRPLTPTHSNTTRYRIPNREIASDYTIQALNITLAAAIYSVTIFTAYKTVLPRTLALEFDGVKSLEDAYRSEYLPLLPLMAGFGAAVKEFVFTPALVVLPTPQDVLNAKFDPTTASLWETVRYNFWGYTTRTKTIIKRTVILMAVSGAHTFVQTWFTLEGVGIKGATVYAGVWVVAAGLAGAALGLVGAV